MVKSSGFCHEASKGAFSLIFPSRRMLSAFSRVSRGRKSGGAFAIRANHRATSGQLFVTLSSYRSTLVLRREVESCLTRRPSRYLEKRISKMRVRTQNRSANLTDVEVQKYSGKGCPSSSERSRRDVLYFVKARVHKKEYTILHGLQMTRHRIRHYLLCVVNVVHVGARRQTR